ncbi:MAG: hypothetical protein ACYCOR_09740 [Acidobacteriaceae bacterium]
MNTTDPIRNAGKPPAPGGSSGPTRYGPGATSTLLAGLAAALGLIILLRLEGTSVARATLIDAAGTWWILAGHYRVPGDRLHALLRWLAWALPVSPYTLVLFMGGRTPETDTRTQTLMGCMALFWTVSIGVERWVRSRRFGKSSGP